MSENTDRRRVWLFRLAAILLSVALLLAVVLVSFTLYVNHCRDEMRSVHPTFSNMAVLRWLYYTDEFREFTRIIAEDDLGRSVTLLDGAGMALVSRNQFVPVDAYGKTRWRFKPSIRVTAVRVWSGLEYRLIVFRETPRFRELVEQSELVHATTFETDEHGFKKSFVPPNPTAPPIMFLGDSFTEGMHVTSESTFVSLIGEKMAAAGIPAPTINTGVGGYSAIDMAKMIEDAGPRFEPRVVVASLFPNDVDIDFIKVVTGGPVEDAQWAEMFGYMDRVFQWCSGNGATLIVSVIPAKQQLRRPDSVQHFQHKVRDWCRERGVHYVDPYERFRELGELEVYFSWDPHFSTKGHRHYADYVFEEILPDLRAAYD